MISLDNFITQAVNGLAGRSEILDWLMIAVSTYSIPVLVGVVALQWWRRDNRPLVRHTLIAAGLSFLLGLGLNQFILLIFDRIRPYDAGFTQLIVAPSADPSFPSDHATATMAIAAALLFSRLLRLQAGAMLAAAGLVCFSRVFIGIHYASDVAGGALIGVIAAYIVTTAFKPESRLSRMLTGVL